MTTGLISLNLYHKSILLLLNTRFSHLIRLWGVPPWFFITFLGHSRFKWNLISGVMVSILTSSVVDCEFESQLGQTKFYITGICFIPAKHAALRRKSKDWLARNRDNMSECADMSIHGLFFQWTSTIQIQLSLLV